MLNEYVFFDNPEFWKAVAFLISCGIVIFPIIRFCQKCFRKKSQLIIQQFEDAESLLEKAQDALKLAQDKSNNIDADVSQILQTAEHSIKTIKEESKSLLDKRMLYRQKENEERVCLIRENGLKKLKEQVLDLAVDTAENVLKDVDTLDNCNHAFTAQSIDELQQLVDDKKNIELLKNIILLEEG